RTRSSPRSPYTTLFRSRPGQEQLTPSAFLEIAENLQTNSEWAKITGMNGQKLELVSLNRDQALTELSNGNVVRFVYNNTTPNTVDRKSTRLNSSHVKIS